MTLSSSLFHHFRSAALSLTLLALLPRCAFDAAAEEGGASVENAVSTATLPGLECFEDVCEPVAACGNGALQGNEQCDDGNHAAGDGCSERCTLEGAFDCVQPGEPCTRSGGEAGASRLTE